MKSLFLLIVAIGTFSGAKSSELEVELPKLHQIKEITLSPSYSCRSQKEFANGYADTALFLSGFTKRYNAPDLLFNGACGSDDYFEAATAGDDMSLISDLGSNISLDELTASRAFNPQTISSFASYSRFVKAAKVEPNHAYAVVLNSRDRRGLFVFTVTEYVPNERVSLRYAVKSYQVVPSGQKISPGFQWNQKNSL
jgi:hypothetical protein